MGERKRDNNYAFIDSQNLYLGIRDQGWELDYKKFRVYLRDKFRVTKASLFIGYISGNTRLYRYLIESGYELVFRPTTHDGTGKVKGNVDAELVLHSAAIEYNNYDKAVIVSGDGDFHCLYKYLSVANKLKNILIPNKKSTSSLLKPYENYFVLLERDKEKLKNGRRSASLRK